MSLTIRQMNAVVDAVAILSSCQRNVLSANWLMSALKTCGLNNIQC